ncbi:MAG: 30S ribosomal protein S2 [Planctomycetes bacterium]|nr:30S ribosomal protein S2 [Planctomycetota bacterium]
MAALVKDLIEAGIHFGQRRSNWNPKMAPYIFGLRNKIHIIDIRQTLRGLLLAKKYLTQTVADGRQVCFVGTKRQARAAVEKYSSDVGMPYVTERWVGGTLTNSRTIRERLKRLDELERLVSSGEIDNYSKKMASQLERERRKITRNLQGIRDMDKHPGCLVIIDVNREINALREARSLQITTIALVDTDGDPDLVDIPIPGNDDSMRSIDVIMRELCAAVGAGKAQRTPDTEDQEAPEEPAPHHRSTRAMSSADRTSSPQGSLTAEPTVRQPRPEGPQEKGGPPSPEGGPNDSKLAGSQPPRPESESAPSTAPPTKVANTSE